MENRQGFPGALPEIVSGWAGGNLELVPGEGFWERIEKIAVRGDMTRGLDTAMHGQSSPRIWLFLHEPGRGELSTAVAMCFARELAFRDQAALVLDGDDRDLALTRWAGRVEDEGWIDLTRYGTSVLTSGIPMPFVGRRGYLLGVGSFAPTDVTGQEIDTLLTRLRRQADDLLIVAPADALGRMWAPAAAIRVLCWDRQTLSETDAAAIARDFEEAGCPLTAAVSFQERRASEEKLVDKVLAETETSAGASDQKPEPSAPEPNAPSPEEEIDTGDETRTGEAVAASSDLPAADREARGEGPPEDSESGSEPGADAEADSGADAEAGWRDLPLEETADAGEELAAEVRSDEEGWEEPLPTPEPDPGRSTSRVFWFGALVAVAVIAMFTVYYFKFISVPPEGPFEPTGVTEQTGPPATDAAGIPPAETVLADSLVRSDSLAMAPADSAAAGAAATVADPVTEAVTDTTVAQAVVEKPPVSEPEPVETTSPAPAASGEFDMSPYREPVGAKGWALHVYSLPTPEATEAQVSSLTRRGFKSEIRTVDLGEKGRWNRIYLGSFASRSAAKAAMPELLTKLRVDWAQPQRF